MTGTVSRNASIVLQAVRCEHAYDDPSSAAPSGKNGHTQGMHDDSTPDHVRCDCVQADHDDSGATCYMTHTVVPVDDLIFISHVCSKH